MSAAQQTPDVIVAPDIENEVPSPVVGPFFPQHPAVSLIDSIPAHPEVPNRLAQVPRQILLPSLAVADLVALSEAVTVGVDAAFPAGINEGGASAIGLDGGDSGAGVDSIGRQIIPQNVAQFWIKLRPTGTAQKSVNHLSRDSALLQILFEGKCARCSYSP